MLKMNELPILILIGGAKQLTGVSSTNSRLCQTSLKFFSIHFAILFKTKHIRNE